MARTKFGAAVKWGVLGAAATWLFDPQQGAERRRQLQEKVLGAAKSRKDELGERFGTSGASNGHAEPMPHRAAEEVSPPTA